MSVIKNITIRANEKSWMTQEVRAMLNALNNVFKAGDMVALRTAKANLNRAIGVAKRAHSQKTQNFFHDPMDTKCMWQGIESHYRP